MIINNYSFLIKSTNRMPLTKISVHEKMKIIYEYFENSATFLSPIPEEFVKNEKSNNDTNGLYSQEEQSMTISDDNESESIYDNIDDLEDANSFSSQQLRMQYLLDKSNTEKLLNNMNSKQNKTVSPKLLYKTISLSSLLSFPSDTQSKLLKYSPIKDTTKNEIHESISLAKDSLDLDICVIKDSVSLGKLSSTNLSQSKSYFSCSKFQSGSSMLLNNINNSQNMNPLIAQTKSGIKSFGNYNINQIVSSTFINQKRFPKHQSYGSKYSEKSDINKKYVNGKIFNQTFNIIKKSET